MNILTKIVKERYEKCKKYGIFIAKDLIIKINDFGIFNIITEFYDNCRWIENIKKQNPSIRERIQYVKENIDKLLIYGIRLEYCKDIDNEDGFILQIKDKNAIH
jgi:hypothetical protein